MYEPRNNLTSFQSLPQIILDLLFRSVWSDRFLHLQHPAEDFLIRESVDLLVRVGALCGALHTRGEVQRDRREPRHMICMDRSGQNRPSLEKASEFHKLTRYIG
jgi:hypothetical protein